jgi:carboxymethylenebutenolidase
MIEEHIDIPTADGSMNSFVVFPEEDGPHPVVFFYMDAPGKREELHDMARRLASVGYFVVLPNLYYRRSRDYSLKERSAEALAEMFAHMGSLHAQTTLIDTQALLHFVDRHAMADHQRLGAVGYCMSGPFVMWAAAQFPQRFQSIASIHGANMATDALDSPHRMAPQIQSECYFACAEIDKWAPPKDIQRLESALLDAKVKHRIEWYPRVEHGFVFPRRDGIYNAPAAERHWERLFALFGRTLHPRA